MMQRDQKVSNKYAYHTTFETGSTIKADLDFEYAETD